MVQYILLGIWLLGLIPFAYGGYAISMYGGNPPGNPPLYDRVLCTLGSIIGWSLLMIFISSFFMSK